jgi:hypothetical protein
VAQHGFRGGQLDRGKPLTSGIAGGENLNQQLDLCGAAGKVL